MKEIQCKHGEICIVDADMYDELMGYYWYINAGYVWTSIKGKAYKIDKIILGADHIAGYDVHHRNENKLDNRRFNFIQLPNYIHGSFHIHPICPRFYRVFRSNHGDL